MDRWEEFSTDELEYLFYGLIETYVEDRPITVKRLIDQLGDMLDVRDLREMLPEGSYLVGDSGRGIIPGQKCGDVISYDCVWFVDKDKE